MKTKSKHRWLALFMVVAMLIGTLPITAFAEDHTHTEDCYAKAGDLLCTIAESEGHTHTADCVCPGGENICGLKEAEGHTHNENCYTYVEDEKSENEETETSSNAGKKELVCSLDEQEGHTHTADCVCPGGEYICGLEESEGHTHSEDCYAQGGELICTADNEDMLLPVAAYAEEKSEAAIGETNYVTLQEAINNAQNGDTIRVLRDISLTEDTLVTIAPDTPKEITIDLNQKTISCPEDSPALTISKPITLNIKNGKLMSETNTTPQSKSLRRRNTCGSNALRCNDSDRICRYLYVDKDDVVGKNKISLENVDITSNEYGVYVNDADITFKSGSIHTTNDETFELDRCSLTIDDGEFITTDDTCMDLSNECTAVINGGYFKSGDDNALYLSYDSKATINGGVFEAPDKAIDAYAENVTLGENLKTVLQDGTTLEDFLNSTYVSVVKTIATVTFISDGQKVAEVLVRKKSKYLRR